MNNSFLWTQRNTLSKEFCDHIIDKFERDEHKSEGRVGYGYIDKNTKSSTDLFISNLDAWKDEDLILENSLGICLAKYASECFSINSELFKFDHLKDTGYQIQRTRPGEFYNWHDDANPYSPNLRLLTFIWYLNDIREEGYTEFIDGTQIAPETGKILIFPATWTYLHRGVSPITETKYICTGWVHCASN